MPTIGKGKMRKPYKPEPEPVVEIPKYNPAYLGREPPKSKIDSVSDELKALRFAVNTIVNHLDSKYSPGIFTPEEHVKMGVPVRE